MLGFFHISKAENGDIHLTRILSAAIGEERESLHATFVLTPAQQGQLMEFFRNEERAMLGSIHADGGASYETWLAERSAKVEDDSVDDSIPATDEEYEQHLAEGCASHGEVL